MSELRSEQRFDISLPGLYKDKWKEAYRADNDDIPRLSSYQAPDGQPVPFIYESLEFSGGQSVDTAEYPFFGLWSNETLNQKPQSMSIQGYFRGEFYLQHRTALVDALMIPTSDDSPGFFDHPLWGRFKVVVENYNIQEAANENGQCKISLTLKRAGVSLETRAAVLFHDDYMPPEETVRTVVVQEFAKTGKDSFTLLQAFGLIKSKLLNNIGRIKAVQTKLNVLSNEINSITNLIIQGVQSPIELAQALVNAIFSIAGTAVSAREITEIFFYDRDNKETAIMDFLSATNYELPVTTATVKQEETKKDAENLYRSVCLCAAADLLSQTDKITKNKMYSYWKQYIKLENSIVLENPDVYKAVTNMRSAVSQKLKQTALVNELKKRIEHPVPLLYLSHYLKCNDEILRKMNLIEDSLLVAGEVSYV